MKNFLLFIFSLPIFLMAQDLPIVNDKIVFEEIVESPGLTKEELYSACKSFVANAFRNAQRVIQTEDERTGLIICKGSTFVEYPQSRKSFIVSGMNVGGMKSFTMKFENKEGRCRVTIYDIFEDNSSLQYGTNHNIEEIFFDLAKRANSATGKSKDKRITVFNESVENVNMAFLGLIKSFKESVSQYKSNDDW